MGMYEQIQSNKNRTLVLFSLFFVFILFLGFIFGEIMGIGLWGLIIAFVIALLATFFSYYYSDSIVIKMSHARPVTKKEFPYLYNVMDGLAIAAGLPTPKKYVIDDTAPNAFATGRDPEHSAIVVTTGLIKKLKRVELEGVIAHEMAHIKNYDSRLQMYAVTMVGIVTFISHVMLRSFMWGGGRRRDMGQIGIALLLIGVVLAILSPLIAQVLKMTISRKREFLADATGAMLTRYPEGLASALEKISKDSEPLEAANNATAHLYIVNPFKKKEWFSGLFSTHPRIADRVKKLRAM
jgi:heat shock protein HtpX